MKRILWLVPYTFFLLQGTAFAQALSIKASRAIICSGEPVTLYAVNALYQSHWLPGHEYGKSATVAPTQTTTYTVISGLDSATYTVFVCPTTTCTTSPVSLAPMLLNTGNDGMLHVRDFGEEDLNWEISRTRNGIYNSAIVSAEGYIPPNYSKPIWTNTQWIGPNATLQTLGMGAYFFRVQFNLTAAEANSLVLNMQFMADNTVMGVSVNDVLIPNSGTPGGSIYGFQAANASSVSMHGHWVAGLNTITVEIDDRGSYVGFVAQLNPKFEFPMPKVNCPGKVFVAADTLELCKGDSVQLFAENSHSYSWTPVTGLSNPSISNPKASPAVSTMYYVRGLDTDHYASDDSVFVLVHDVAQIQLGNRDTMKCSDQPMVLNVAVPGTTVLWQDGSTNPVYSVADSGLYYVTVTNQCGTVSDTINVRLCCEAIAIVNLFTPNGDAHNEYFNIGCLGQGGWELKVFNSWGSLVYSDSDYQNNWNGNQISDGVYYYQLSRSGEENYKGWVHIIR